MKPGLMSYTVPSSKSVMAMASGLDRKICENFSSEALSASSERLSSVMSLPRLADPSTSPSGA